MVIGTVFTGGIFGFVAAILSGLALGLGWVECLAVYASCGLVVALMVLTARGLWCAGARAHAALMYQTES